MFRLPPPFPLAVTTRDVSRSDGLISRSSHPSSRAPFLCLFLPSWHWVQSILGNPVGMTKPPSAWISEGMALCTQSHHDQLTYPVLFGEQKPTICELCITLCIEIYFSYQLCLTYLILAPTTKMAMERERDRVKRLVEVSPLDMATRFKGRWPSNMGLRGCSSELPWKEKKVWKKVCVCAQSYLTPCNPMDCSPPGSSVCGIFQARIQEWAAISFSRASSKPRGWTHVSWVSCTGRILYH